MDGYPVAETAKRAGVSDEYLARLIELGIVKDPGGSGFSAGEIRIIQLAQAVDQAGVPLEGLGEVVRSGHLSLDFIKTAGNEVFNPLGELSFDEVSERTGISLELLGTLREAMGGTIPRPDDRMREDELAVVPLVRLLVEQGSRPVAIERNLRVYQDAMRRIAEAEAEWWRTDVYGPMVARGMGMADLAAFSSEFSPKLTEVSAQAILAIYHAHQRVAWSTNIVDGIATQLEEAGLHRRTERLPAMCFLDITGYTRLTQEQGDDAAAALAEKLARLVQRLAQQHGGRPVKWLGDGVLLYFPEPGRGVLAALDMLDSVADAGLPPAHVGLHAGPVVFQEGDFYGQTVNLAARIGEYARPGEVLVSQEVVEASAGADGVAFKEIGPVELKGVGAVVTIHEATRAPNSPDGP